MHGKFYTNYRRSQGHSLTKVSVWPSQRHSAQDSYLTCSFAEDPCQRLCARSSVRRSCESLEDELMTRHYKHRSSVVAYTASNASIIMIYRGSESPCRSEIVLCCFLAMPRSQRVNRRAEWASRKYSNHQLFVKKIRYAMHATRRTSSSVSGLHRQQSMHHAEQTGIIIQTDER